MENRKETIDCVRLKTDATSENVAITGVWLKGLFHRKNILPVNSLQELERNKNVAFVQTHSYKGLAAASSLLLFSAVVCSMYIHGNLGMYSMYHRSVSRFLISKIFTCEQVRSIAS